MATRRQHGEGSIYQRGRRGGQHDSTQPAQWVAVADLGWRPGPGGKPIRDRREFTAATMEEAKARRQRFLDRRRDGFTMPKGRPPYVSEWMLHWLVNVAQPRVAPTTFYGSYDSKVRDHIMPFFERLPLPDLSEEDIEDFHRHLAVTLSAASVRQVHRIMSSAIKAAVIRGKIPRNPCSNVPPPPIDREASVPTAEETALILERCKTWDNGCRWLLAIATGARQGELLGLQWANVSLTDPASVTISRSAARVRGELVYKQPKSKQSRRAIQVGPVTVAALREHRKTQVPSIANDLVFTDARGQPVHPRRDWQDLQNLLADLGLPRYSVHSLRHVTATLLLEAGQDARVVQAVMGHSTPHFTQQQYQHVRPVLHQRAADAMNDIIGRLGS